MSSLYERIAEIIKKGQSLAIATVVKASGSSPRGEAAKMIVLVDGTTEGSIGGGELERQVREDAMEAIRAGKSLIKEYKLASTKVGGIGMACGGDTEVFIEVVTPSPKLLIFGGGHIGLALYNIAITLGFRVIVVDDRREFATGERFPKAEVHCCNVTSSFVRRVTDRNTLVVIATRDHHRDKAALKHLLSTPASYIGMIGSKAKVSAIKKRLRNEGISQQKLNQVFTPIGLDIGAETPEEIAVSILAEIIHFLRIPINRDFT